MVRYSLPLMKGDRLSFSSHRKCHQEATHQWVATVTSLTIGTDMLAFAFDNWLEICFFMVPSILVARLLAYCVLIGSLAELHLAFCMRNVLACCKWLKLSLAGWYHQWSLSWLWKSIAIPNSFHGVVPRTRSCSGLISLLYSTAPGSD
jgi:hypothetical protein